MSLYGALFTGVSGLNAQSRAMAVASNNIANVNTTAYKKSESQFSALLAATSSTSDFAAGGVEAIAFDRINRQGLLQTTASSTDLAINGNGFFAVTTTPTSSPEISELLFTRAGAFTADADGNLRNAAGLYLQGWRLDSTGNLPANLNDLEPVNIAQFTGTATPSTEVTIRANVDKAQTDYTGAYTASNTAQNMAGGTITPHFQRTLEIVDSQGGPQPVTLAFLKTGVNSWNYEVIYEGSATNVTTGAGIPIASGTVTFNTDGTIATPAVGTPPEALIDVALPWSPASGLSAQTIRFDLGDVGAATGLTQYDGNSTIISSFVNGALYGDVVGVEVDDEGVISAIFNNGVQQAVYKLPVASFANPNGLGSVSGNAYIRTNASGSPTLLEANVGGMGSIASQSLEASTVDLATEFTDLITIQRAYSAATRIITTADEMLEEMLRVKR